VRLANQELEKVMPRVQDTVDAMELPAGLRERIAKEFERAPTWSWDRVVFDLVKRLPLPKRCRKKVAR
jgi:hypothetical protein